MRRGKGVLVTGATSGIGEATARASAARGHRVFAAGRRVDRLEALVGAFTRLPDRLADTLELRAVGVDT